MATPKAKQTGKKAFIFARIVVNMRPVTCGLLENIANE